MSKLLTKAEILALTPEQRAFLGVKSPREKPPGRPKIAGFLTPAQAKVAAFMLLGMSQRQIAKQILLVKQTVVQHEREIRRRCGVDTREQAVSFLQQKYGTARHLAWRITRENRGN